MRPLNLEQTLQLVILLSPHLAKIEAYWPEFKEALQDRELLPALFMTFRAEMAGSPGDIVRAFSILIGKDFEWTARNATAADLIEALPVLDRVNNFKQLWVAIKSLGLTVKYG